MSWTRETVASRRDELEALSAESLVAFALETFGDGLVLATSFGPQTILLMEWIAKLRPQTEIFYLDTGLLFEETHALRRELEQRLGIRTKPVTPLLSLEEQAETFGQELWSRDPEPCCFLRKVLPLRRQLQGKQAWMSGIRATQSAERAAASVIEWDETNGLVKLNPLLHWTRERIDAELEARGLPVNPLLKQGYRSVGCRPCTARVDQNGDERSGRWAGFAKTECGLHRRPARSDLTGAPQPVGENR